MSPDAVVGVRLCLLLGCYAVCIRGTHMCVLAIVLSYVPISNAFENQKSYVIYLPMHRYEYKVSTKYLIVPARVNIDSYSLYLYH
jgi:hypothetical protein